MRTLFRATAAMIFLFSPPALSQDEGLLTALEVHGRGQVLLVEPRRQFADLRRIERDRLFEEASHAMRETRIGDGGNRDGREARSSRRDQTRSMSTFGNQRAAASAKEPQ